MIHIIVHGRKWKWYACLCVSISLIILCNYSLLSQSQSYSMQLSSWDSTCHCQMGPSISAQIIWVRQLLLSLLLFKTSISVLVVLSPSGSEMGWNFSSRLLQNHTGGESSIFLPGSIFMNILGDQNLSDCDVRLVVSMWDIDNRLLEVNSSNGSSIPPSLVHGRW